MCFPCFFSSNPKRVLCACHTSPNSKPQTILILLLLAGKWRKSDTVVQDDYNTLNVHDDQFDMSEALISVGIALAGVTALTKKKWLLAVAPEC
jgi:hypothetical protein